MHLKNIIKRAAIFSMAAVLGVAGVSGAVAFPATNTPQITKAAVKNYTVTIKRGETIRLSSVVPGGMVKNSNLEDVSNSNDEVVDFTSVGTGILDGQITGLKKGIAQLSFFKKANSSKKQLVYYTVTVKVKK